MFILFTGFGSGIAYVTTLVAIENHFKRHRAIAFGIASLGAALANMSFPWITTSLIQYYGWRGSLMISSGLVAQICVASMLLKPVPSRTSHNQNAFQKDISHTKSGSFIMQTKQIFRNSCFILHCINSVLLTLTVSVAITHVIAYAESEDVSPEWSSALITTMGASNIGVYIYKKNLVQA